MYYSVKFTVYFVLHFLAAEVVNITIVQHPPSVEVDKNVTLTCNATAERKITELVWFATALKEALRKTDAGVVDLLEPALDELGVSSVLILSVTNKNEDGWPKTVQCRVVLEPADKDDSNIIFYTETHEVVVTGKSVMEYMLKCFVTIHTPTLCMSFVMCAECCLYVKHGLGIHDMV